MYKEFSNKVLKMPIGIFINYIYITSVISDVAIFIYQCLNNDRVWWCNKIYHWKRKKTNNYINKPFVLKIIGRQHSRFYGLVQLAPVTFGNMTMVKRLSCQWEEFFDQFYLLMILSLHIYHKILLNRSSPTSLTISQLNFFTLLWLPFHHTYWISRMNPKSFHVLQCK